MSKVTIQDLYWEISRDQYANNVWMKYKDIEVVPRKMVELIIELCDKECKNEMYDGAYRDGVRITAYMIKTFAEGQLKQFEEDE